MKMLHPLLGSFLKCATVFLTLAGATAFALTTPTAAPATGTIAAGNSHTVALKSNGTVWAWGDNYYGQLGDGTTTDRPTAVQANGLTGIVSVAAGYFHTVALKSDGTVWAWGLNYNGQLGDGTTLTTQTRAVSVIGLYGMVAVAAAGNHTVALKNDGTVWTWGNNEFGQLGDGTTTSNNIARQVPNLSGVIAVEAGDDFTVALKNDGTMWAWGINSHGELGDGGIPRSTTTPGLMSGFSSIIAMATGGHHTVALKSDGTVWTSGNNAYGQLGDGTTSTMTTAVQVLGQSNVTTVAAGNAHTVVSKSDGSVWAWGRNDAGQLGNDTITTMQATAVPVSRINGVVAVAAGDYHTAALKGDGTVWAWGRANDSQLGDGSIINRANAVQVSRLTDVLTAQNGQYFSVVLKKDGTVWSWGNNSAGQLGDGTQTTRATELRVSGLSDIVAVAAGANYAFAVKNDGTAWAWGYNVQGQLGDGTTTGRTNPIRVSGLNGVSTITAGFAHAVALKSDGTVWAWGNNNNGRLGDGTFVNRFTPVSVSGLSNIVAVQAGNDHTIALKGDGTVWAWGSNYYGQLGDGTTTNRIIPVPASGLTGIVAITTGADYSLALKNDGTLWAWGYNGYGQLGDGTTTNRTTAVRVSGLGGVIRISAGLLHSVALKNDGTVWAWGLNDRGQLGDGTMTQRLAPVLASGLSGSVSVEAGGYHTLVVKSDGTLRGCGDNTYGQLAFFSSRLTQSVIRLIYNVDDTDQDGMSDAWEIQYFGNLSHKGSTDTDNDGLTDLQEFAKGSDPTGENFDADTFTDFVDLYPNDFYNSITPALTVFSGDNQTAAPGTFNAEPLDVAVWNAAATAPLVNAPVIFSVTSGEGNLAATLNGPLSPSLAVRADQDGTAKIYFKHGSSFGGTSTITTTAGNAQLLMHSTTSKQSQTITFADPSSQTFGTPLPLSATASSGLPITFAATSGPVSIANGIATFTGTGSVTITAQQNGDGTYSAAPDVARTFNVNPGSQPTVGISPSTSSVSVGEAVIFTANGGVNNYVWGGSASGSGTSQTVTFNSVGTFNVTVYAQAGGNYAQSNIATAAVTVHDTTPPVIAAQDNLTIEATSAAGASVTFTPSANDLIDGPVAVSASPLSGSTFALGTNTVTLTATDAAGNTATNTFTVTVHDTTAPVTTLPTDQTLEATGPAGAVATFSVSASDLVDGEVAVSYSSASGSTFALGANTVTIIATDAAGNIATNNFTVTVVDTTAPVITVPATITAEATSTAGATVALIGSATDLVNGNVSVSFSPASDTVFPLGETTVTATTTDAAGNTATATLLVKVVDTIAPVLSLPADITVEAFGPTGTAVIFVAHATDTVNGDLTVSYSTEPGSIFALGETVVTVTAIDATGNVITGNFKITVVDHTGPVITVPANQTLEATGPSGASTTYSVSATDLIDGIVPVSVSSASGSTFSLGVNTVTATATDAAGNTSTRTFTVTVRDTTAPVITVPADQTLEATGPSGAIATYSPSSSDLVDGAVSVSASPVSGSTFAPGVNTVTVTATDTSGNTATRTFTVTVGAFTAPLITTPPLPQSVVVGQSVTFNVAATGTNPMSYQWLYNGSLITGATGSSYTVLSAAMANAGSYNVWVTNAAGSVSSAAANLIVNSPPVITTQPFNQTINAYASVVFRVIATGTGTLTYQWYLNGTPLVDASATTDTLWFDSAPPSYAGNYTVVVTNQYGSVTSNPALLSINVYPTIVDSPRPLIVAVGSSATFRVQTSGGTEPITYQWKFGTTLIPGATGSTYTIPSAQMSNAGTYSVIVTNPAGSAGAGSATLTVQNPPAITTQPVNLTVTAGKNALFKVVASGTATLNYQWYFNGSAIPGATAANYTVTAAQSDNVGSYSATVTNAVGSVSSVAVTLTVNYPVVITSQPASQSITLGTSVTFSVNANGTAPFTYKWRLGGVAIAGATSSVYTIPAAQTSDAGNYSVVVTNVVGSVTSTTAVLKVNTPPAITTQPISKSVTAGTSVTFRVVATGTATLTYQWKLNNVAISGATASTYVVVANATTVGTYTVVVTNVAGTVTSSAATLTLK